MASGYVNKLNKIQAERAAKAGLPENGVSEAFSKMASSGELFKGRVFVKSDTTDKDGLRTLVFFDKTKDVWVFQQDIKGQVQNRFESDTEDDVYAKVREHAQQVEAENDPEVLTCNRWMRESKWGREFSTFECLAAWQQLEKYVPAGGVTIKALDHAFTTILDLDDHTQNWFRFEQKRDRLQRERVEAQVRTPHENLTAENEARKSEDNSNRAKDLKTLRHEALFSGRVKTTPSTGTVIRK